MKTLKDQLDEKGLSRTCTGEVERKSIRPKHKYSERMSNREWVELMGVNRDTYKRVGGAIRKR
ncbi:hypothetical protein QT711_03425 [Sporosarcina saromensis]|uniref:Uncharacterized protein n=1 Tax=Sporosarcina saromensis TaxID=359365 RepID=A0ABU4G5H5_9BACL|nr:hypothetical protein [Sporosarcina saromensis]MDW0112221.1 hypothetical protein [Sporosarcina saromensis]